MSVQPAAPSRRLPHALKGGVGRIAAQAAVQIGGRAVSIVAGVAASVVLGRYLGPAVYGQYVYVIAYFGIFSTVASFGLETLAVRDLAAQPEQTDDILSTLLTLRTAFAVATVPLAIAFLFATEASDQLRLLVLITSPTLLTGAVSSVGALFAARLTSQYRVASELIQPVVFLAAAFAIVAAGLGIREVVAAYVVSFVLYSAVLFALSRRFARPRLRINSAYARRILRGSLPVGVGAIFFQIYYRVDILMLDRLRGGDAVGLYGVAYGFFAQGPALFSLIATTLFPVLVVRARTEAGGLVGAVGRSAGLAVGLGLAGAATCAVAGPVVLRLMYGGSFEGAGTALAILGVALPFSFSTYVFNYSLVAIDRHHTTWVVNGLAAVLNVALNWFMIPSLSYIGTSYATVATEACVCIVQGAILGRVLLARSSKKW